MSDKPWYEHTITEVAAALKTDLESGLTQAEAAYRLGAYGPNELIKVKIKTPWQILLDQFKDFMIGLLLVAAVISGFVGEPQDTLTIVVIVLLNAVIGFVQEYRAEKAMEELKKLSAPSATVIRDGKRQEISSTEVVPGDIVLLEAGNIVPADLRLAQAANLSVNESMLTGESLPVDKVTEPLAGEHLLAGDQINMAFSGTQVIRGRGVGIVTATAMDTEIGKIAGLVQEEELKTPLQKRLAAFGRSLVFAVIGICAIVFSVGVMRGADPALMFLTAVSLAVAAVPEALPAVVTIALALGAQKMVQAKALIRRLPAVETLGSVTYICSDKTGTLTQNKMKVEQAYFDNQLFNVSGEGYIPTGIFTDAEGRQVEVQKLPTAVLLMQAAVLNNDAKIELVDREEEVKFFGDPTEVCLLVMAAKAGFFKEELEKLMPRIDELAFDSVRKKMSTVHQLPDGHFISFTKGAFESMAPYLTGYIKDGQSQPLSQQELKQIEQRCVQLATQGLRTLALAYKNWPTRPEAKEAALETDLTLIGVVGVIDPPRPEAIKAVAECKTAGIKPVMITGDHPETAKVIAERLGIYEPGSLIVTGQELIKMPLAEFEEKVERVSVYARVAPEHKVKIVKALQDKHQFVAMTGDGVNDAPALKNADIGVAMGITGTDVSKEAADMVLLDDNFATIVKAVKEGRRIYDNIRRFIRYILASNVGEIGVMFFAPFLGLPIPLKPIHILWINLVTDGLPGLALANEAAEVDIMQKPPRQPQETVFAGGLGAHIIWVGLLLAGVSLFAQGWFITQGGHWQTSIFTVLCLAQIGNSLANRSEKLSLFQMSVKTNLPLYGAALLTFALQMAVVYVPALNPIFKTKPLTLPELVFTLLLSTIVFTAVELEKFFRRRAGVRPKI